eukprot:CAMPEP_0176315216 /NCGR_PEP_ID=MMETSP0121_2-20121125/68083_1 /TAXON_ID=160619 /ORGANISM="Kryptoperidinium foliaceum, Strain CCMP 1326" /LENGTH=444 /DNA_ID=CAMNT_0017657349 /DNA_START=94 /DNA_END=1428 /DNA_ORIENTATION=+
MRAATTTSAAVALLLATQQQQHSVQGFAPPRPSLQSRTASAPSVFQHRMVMDKSDPLNIVDAEIVSMDRHATSMKKNASTDPTPYFVDLFQKTIGETNPRHNMKFMAAALAMALAFMPLASDAAMSGGRMGGSYSRPSQSRSMPSRSSGGGYSRGYSSGYYSRPSVAITPGIGFGYSPFITPFSPFGGYGYGGGGVISYSRGPSFFDLIFFGGLLLAVTSFFRNAADSAVASSPFERFGSSASSALGSGTSVVLLSVALEVPNRDDPSSILNVLNRLSRTSNTDSRVGIQNLTSQVALELLRRRSSIVSASSYYQHYQDSTKAGRDYESKAIKERSKFEKETVSKYGGVDYSSGKSPSSSSLAVDGKATMAVVTLVLAIDGDSTKISRNINSISDVEEALRRIASDAKVDDCLQSVEILWTPEDRGETLSFRDVLADYPELRSV